LTTFGGKVTSDGHHYFEAELDQLTEELEQLSEASHQLEAALDQTNRPLRVTTTCLLAR
jgi:hypothetical protein